MSPQDHNKTIMVLFSLIAIIPTLLLCASPWMMAAAAPGTVLYQVAAC